MKQKLTLQVMPGGIPTRIRCYDSDGYGDRYTVVFTGNYRRKTGGQYMYLGMDDQPFHPLGIGMHGHSNIQIDRPSSRHLGKRIAFATLPSDCQKLVISDYNALWELGI